MAIILSCPRAGWFNFRLLCAHNGNGKCTETETEQRVREWERERGRGGKRDCRPAEQQTTKRSSSQSVPYFSRLKAAARVDCTRRYPVLEVRHITSIKTALQLAILTHIIAQLIKPSPAHRPAQLTILYTPCGTGATPQYACVCVWLCVCFYVADQWSWLANLEWKLVKRARCWLSLVLFCCISWFFFISFCCVAGRRFGSSSWISSHFTAAAAVA